MAKITSPLMSITAAGSIGSMLTFSTTTSSPVAKRMSAPAKRTSAAQQARRVIYIDAVSGWHALTETEKAEYSAQAKPLNITGYNLFLSQILTAAPPAGTIWDTGATTWDAGATIWDV